MRFERFTRVRVSLHAFTGCVTVSVFTGLEKTKAFRKMARNVQYVKMFESLGEESHLGEEMLKVLESFVCCLYNYDDMKDINLL